MIPPILHQVWKTSDMPPAFRAYAESWRMHNPGWDIRLWSDRMLVDFVAEHYPALLSVYCGYPDGIMRADAARYMLLHRFGGVYADLDCECVAPFDTIMHEDRVVLCYEPELHNVRIAHDRRLPYFVFNGTMASPANHPFWPHLLSLLPEKASDPDVLMATGPGVLTLAQRGFPRQDMLSLNSATLFAPLDIRKTGQKQAETLSVHHWAGTWYTRRRRDDWHGLRTLAAKSRYWLTRGPVLDRAAAQCSVAAHCLEAGAPKGNHVAILVPTVDAADHIEPFLRRLSELDHPAERTKLVFGDGGSRDGGWERLEAAAPTLRARYCEVLLLPKPTASRIEKARPKSSRRQRGAELAALRNHMIRAGLDETDDWALWMDVDLWRFPADILEKLIATGRRIVAANCVKAPGGASADPKSYVSGTVTRDHRYFRHVRDGLYRAPASSLKTLSAFRHLPLAEMDSVGAAMLLVDASLHRGGLVFPEQPYRDRIEAEGFSQLASDLGIKPIGLPAVEVIRAP